MAVGTTTVVESDVGAGAGASAAVTETADTAIVIRAMTAKSLIIFIASMKELCNSILNRFYGREGGE
ncbi:hypothetical protein L1987_67406 [Smallanthus sonchifolius]|uniref:Uncharacterized protein n=1 Tax=Smallanthus sonchifolius TaxID=185202 RepID=A0ACB9B246_9ASTR|nr:hypothetical protein L1987_67406 [Smallanthus sonchifolius]